MTYNVNSHDDKVALRTEITTDPISMGYAGLPYSDTKKLTKFINDAENNAGGESAGHLFSHSVLMDTWEPKGVQNEMLPWIQQLISEERSDISRHEAKYRANCGAGSLAALDAVIVQLSRAEVLFGQGTVLSSTDITSSLNYAG